MNCKRCQGLQEYTSFHDNEGVFYGYRCINCGSITDEVIERNKTNPLPKGEGELQNDFTTIN